MSTLHRFNEKTGRKEFYIQVEGIPGGYWTPLGLCDRCYTFNKCLGLARLSKEEWEEFEQEYIMKKNILVETDYNNPCM
jgi:hypothetical protein